MQRGLSQALFSGTQSRDKRQWAQSTHRQFPLNIKKYFFAVLVMVRWKRLPKVIVEFSSWRTSKATQA